MVAEVRVSDRYIARVKSPDLKDLTTAESLCGEFRDYFHKLLTREPEQLFALDATSGCSKVISF